MFSATPSKTASAVILLLLTGPQLGAAQPSLAQPDLTIDNARRTAVIDELLSRLAASYVFPDVAKKMEGKVRERAARGEYDSVTSAQAFAELLTNHLQEVSRDKHLRVRYSFEPLSAEARESGEPSESERAAHRQQMNWMNHSFNKVERLRGNVGYIEFWAFFDPEFGAATVAAAMNFVADTDALIIDLRHNGGGDPAMVALICSYLFDEEPVHLNDLYWRDGDRTEEFWTHRDLPGKRYPTKDVYVLTSGRTFSGAEEFAYNLQNLGRATIVGETTGGGAHPGEDVRIDDHFGAFIPAGRAINPITKTNWEGTGVKPDIEVPADKALPTARLMALKKSLPNIAGPQFQAGVRGEIEALERELSGLEPAP